MNSQPQKKAGNEELLAVLDSLKGLLAEKPAEAPPAEPESLFMVESAGEAEAVAESFGEAGDIPLLQEVVLPKPPAGDDALTGLYAFGADEQRQANSALDIDGLSDALLAASERLINEAGEELERRMHDVAVELKAKLRIRLREEFRALLDAHRK